MEKVIKEKGYLMLFTRQPLIPHFRNMLSRMNCFGWANFCTGTAVGTNIGINRVDITFRDCLNRALIYTGSTSNTIFTDYVSHNK